jgi:peroxiredoxin
MAIQTGEMLPLDLKLKEIREGELKDVILSDVFKGRKVVVFAVPGAFTPTCSKEHLPGFVQQAEEFRKKGVDEVVCLAVNDAFVMDAWAEQQGAKGQVRLIADGNAEFTKAVGLDVDASGFGLGLRSRRYAMLAVDGRVEELLVEPGPGLTCSSAQVVLEKLK